MAVVISGTTGITTPTESVATTIGVGGATPSASGAGITFPATASLSTNANTLDDYEEGTWNLTLTPGSGSITVSSNTGYYVKIGKVVYINMWWRKIGESGLSGTLTASGFPFTFSADATNVARQRIWLSGYNFVSLTNRSVGWIVPTASTSIADLFMLSTAYDAGQTLTAGNLASSNTEIYINGFYMTDQ